MKVGFIGVGNMAKAIITGMVRAGFSGEDILVHSGHLEHYEGFAKQNQLVIETSNAMVAQKADVVVLAVQPMIAEKVLGEIKDALQSDGKLLASVVSGLDIAHIQTIIGERPVLRVMPNVNVEIGEGMTGLAASGQLNLNLAPFKNGKKVFELVGKVMEISEDDFSTFGAIAGSAPAYAYFFIDALSRAGVKYGLNKQAATEIAAQVVNGSAKMVLESDENPAALIDKVSSPGGTTVAGFLAMEEAGFMTAVVKGIDATIGKEKEE
ncbi:pyrroline-5-carboxylate reductase [Pediococcus damnosus LMG 28219]|uniref:pyrroline-5-carboxylate reductase n=1 Tax=Pediococcus damnosus TaxID=51663 RepID=UPI00061E933E|nr:pyrroline-5-carboxylate reductase [Pediococcus damnosus]AMV60147.1 Pyrroline-5-carboxylate reductase [Pediococcus damnosus]AMV64392.1 Pyrroline-5-carboxylate reductase [Pediococcus damnosus]AMV69746.1 Pyrroline-5-carboxylate reductase [Pediococcus damnosus]KJU73755.1 pyrroline-5-carboxylate reductase [Pediococcus damnosus LMG 28219]PIO81462.1 pyrroline-5-carboxylate reductase [Pediococcus damnosus]